MNMKMTKREHARRLATALRSTSKRHALGMMSRPTWKKHMRSLWCLAEDKGLKELVLKELGF